MIRIAFSLMLLATAAPMVGPDSTTAPAAGAAGGARRGPLEVRLPPMWQVRPNMPALRDTIGADVEGLADSLRCRIVPFCAHVWPDTQVRFRVRVANRSRRAIVFVRPPQDGSARAAPLVSSRITGPHLPPAAWDVLVAPRSADAMAESDFIGVPAGKEVDLFGPGGYLDPSWSRLSPGRYTEEFSYSTEEGNPRPWLGTLQPDTLDATWSARFRRVPRVTLHAECTVEVQQR